MTYYIYHIPSKLKIGCSVEPKERAKDQGYLEYEILEEHEDIYIASKREIELQREYGYRVDSIPYYQTLENQSIEGKRKGGKIAGSKNLKSGHIQALGKEWGTKNILTFEIRSKGGKTGGKTGGKRNWSQVTVTCPHCGKEGCKIVMTRWHFDNCKLQTKKN